MKKRKLLACGLLKKVGEGKAIEVSRKILKEGENRTTKNVMEGFGLKLLYSLSGTEKYRRDCGESESNQLKHRFFFSVAVTSICKGNSHRSSENIEH